MSRFMTDEQRERLARKPGWTETLPLVELGETKEKASYYDYRDEMEELTEYEAREMLDELIAEGSFQETEFVVDLGVLVMVVNTEGFDYPRYAARLVEAEVEFFRGRE